MGFSIVDRRWLGVRAPLCVLVSVGPQRGPLTGDVPTVPFPGSRLQAACSCGQCSAGGTPWVLLESGPEGALPLARCHGETVMMMETRT